MSGSWVMSTMVRPSRVEVLEQPEHVGGRRRVEVAGRLVGEDHRRLGHERARDRRRAAAGLPRARRDGGRRGRRARPRSSARAARAPAVRRRRCPRRRAAARRCATPAGTASRLNCWNTKPMNTLRTSASWFSSNACTSWPARRNTPVVGHVEAAEDVHQRRLARSRRPDDGDELVLVDAQRHRSQRGDLELAAR